MKLTKRMLSISGVLALLCSFGMMKAQDRNDVLFVQASNDGFYDVIGEVMLDFYDDWRVQGVRKMRTQEGEDTPGTYRSLIEFDSRGHVAHKEDDNGRTYSVTFDKGGNIRRVHTFQLGTPISSEYFYYTREGKLKKSTLKMAKGTKELERFYDRNFRMTRQRKYEAGALVKTLNFEWAYDAKGRVKGMTGPGRSVSCFYEGEQLTQVRERNGGTLRQWNLVYGDKGLQKIKVYEEKGEDLILTKVTNMEYNSAGMIAKMKEQGRDRNVIADVTNYYYDVFSKDAMAHRGDWDGGGYGFGTPVIIEWDSPDYDKLVIDSMQVLKLKLKPGINQKMPNIKNMTLRLNHAKTEKEIGGVVLQKLGEGDNFFVEEKLPLSEGHNTIFLEVETDHGRFSSGERFITYKNPKRQIKVRNLHLLAVGIEDYNADHLDLDHTSDDIAALVTKLEAQEGSLFGEVRTNVLLDSMATRQNVEDAVRKIKGQAAADDLVLIYFAGHGEEMDGNFYLKPHDVAGDRSDLAETAIDNRWMLEEISRYNASTLYFLDASHPLKVEDESLDIGVANMDEVKSDFEDVIDNDEDIRIFMSSTSTKQKAQLGDAGQSHFVTALLEGLEGKADESGNSNGFVTVNELSDYVSDRILGMTGWKQKPTMAKRGIGLVPVTKIQE